MVDPLAAVSQRCMNKGSVMVPAKNDGSFPSVHHNSACSQIQ